MRHVLNSHLPIGLTRRVFIIILTVAGLSCCAPARSSYCDETIFAIGESQGLIAKELKEASGIIASVCNPGMLWAINDGGNNAELVLVDKHASTQKVYTLQHINNRDWEDIALGGGTSSSKHSFLYIGDIGDNNKNHTVKTIYRIREPRLTDSTQIVDVEKLIVKFPGSEKDAEAMMIDPRTNNLYVLSKEKHETKVYEVTWPFKADTLRAVKVAQLPYTKISSASISPEGDEIVMKNHSSVYYWKRFGNQSITSALKQPARALPYKAEMQGESICFARDGSGYYTLSESRFYKRAALMFYKKK